MPDASRRRHRRSCLSNSDQPRGRAALNGNPDCTKFTELWFNFKPILLEVGLPALLMGFAFPLANAIVQRAEASVGRRAGVLYLSNTVGAVCGSLAAGFLLLPAFGIQGSATVLTVAAALAVVPLCLATRPAFAGTVVGSTCAGGAASGCCCPLTTSSTAPWRVRPMGECSSRARASPRPLP
jgi:hypothetical protein